MQSLNNFLTWFRSTPWPLLVISIIYLICSSGIIGFAFIVTNDTWYKIESYIHYLHGTLTAAALTFIACWYSLSVGNLGYRTAIAYGFVGIVYGFQCLNRYACEMSNEVFQVYVDWNFTYAIITFAVVYFASLTVFSCLRKVFAWRIEFNRSNVEPHRRMQVSVSDIFILTLNVSLASFALRFIELHELMSFSFGAGMLLLMHFVGIPPLFYYAMHPKYTPLFSLLLSFAIPIVGALVAFVLIALIRYPFIHPSEANEDGGLGRALLVTKRFYPYLFLLSVPLGICKYLGYELRTYRNDL